MAEQQVLEEPQADAVPAKPRLELKTEIKDVGPCKKHVRVVVPKDAIAEVVAEAVKEYTGQAEIPGFRVGKVPASLVRKRFKKEIAEQVKQRVLAVSLEQIAEESKIDPVNQPNIDLDIVDIPEDSDLEYEFDVEVRPTFDLPSYKGLKINRPAREITDADIESYLHNFSEQYGIQKPVEDAVAAGDYVNVDIVVHKDDTEYNKHVDQLVCVMPVLKFQDGEVTGFDQLLIGAKAGDTRRTQTTVSMESSFTAMRGETLGVEFTVLDVKRIDIPVIDDDFAVRVGFTNIEQLKTAIRRTLERQVKYEQRRSCRSQITEQITESANWDLPEEMVAKQVDNAMHREIFEMQQAGFTQQRVNSYKNDLYQQSVSMTRRNLKEHFILDRVATEEKIDVSELEIEQEILAMAFQRGESPRRVRARLIKSGVIENLYAQIRERKAVDFILESAVFTDVPFSLPHDETAYAIEKSLSVTSGADAATVDDDDSE